MCCLIAPNRSVVPGVNEPDVLNLTYQRPRVTSIFLTHMSFTLHQKNITKIYIKRKYNGSISDVIQTINLVVGVDKLTK